MVCCYQFSRHGPLNEFIFHTKHDLTNDSYGVLANQCYGTSAIVFCLIDGNGFEPKYMPCSRGSLIFIFPIWPILVQVRGGPPINFKF